MEGLALDFGNQTAKRTGVLALERYDTYLSRAECFGGAGVCDSRALFTVSKSF